MSQLPKCYSFWPMDDGECRTCTLHSRCTADYRAGVAGSFIATGKTWKNSAAMLTEPPLGCDVLEQILEDYKFWPVVQKHNLLVTVHQKGVKLGVTLLIERGYPILHGQLVGLAMKWRCTVPDGPVEIFPEEFEDAIDYIVASANAARILRHTKS